MDFNFSNSVRLADDVLVKQLDNTCVILNLNTESYYGLDETGYQFYQYLIEAQSIEEAYQKICEDFDQSKEKLKQDLKDLIEDLVESKILIIDD